MKSIKFYFTTYYREHGLNVSLELVKKAKETVKYKALLLGNSIEDSLLGFNQTMSNISCLLRSKDVSHLKNTFANKPAIIVSAGPSLNKNIAKLKDMKNKAIVIAVDTIASRLCNEGIIPDFICSVEREVETYTYFYENKQYPSETTLVGPMVLYPPIFEEFKGDIILPMREHVGEFNWIRKVFDIHGENYIETGNSCAHVAFGFAKHIGASPIVLVGQDLAFGSTTEQSHAVVRYMITKYSLIKCSLKLRNRSLKVTTVTRLLQQTSGSTLDYGLRSKYLITSYSSLMRPRAERKLRIRSK